MRRRNVQQAFVGEPDHSTERTATQYEGEDAVEYDVQGGRMMVTVPAGTPDDEVLQRQGYLSGELTMEDGRTLTFEIQDGAVGAQWNILEEQPARGVYYPSGDSVGLRTLEPPGGV
jgi:hypothetical protein